MIFSYTLTGFLVAFFLSFHCLPALAQEPQDEEDSPRWMVVEYFKCDWNAIGELNEMARNKLAPVADRMIEADRIKRWGVQNHTWGDSWNFNIYWVVDDVEELTSLWAGLTWVVDQEHPGFLEKLFEHCHEHKDNIYGLIVTGSDQ